MATLEKGELLTLTAEIVSAYTANNAVPPSELSDLLANVHQALATVGTEQGAPEPALPIKKSVSRSHIVCLECGKKQKMLKRHLRTSHDTNPDDYRERWRLPAEYPMVAPEYAASRSKLAKKIGLGTKRGRQSK
jgi:predicted transcriptional regulator